MFVTGGQNVCSSDLSVEYVVMWTDGLSLPQMIYIFGVRYDHPVWTSCDIIHRCTNHHPAYGLWREDAFSWHCIHENTSYHTHTHTLQKQLVCQRVFFLLVIHDRERLNSVGCVLRSHWLPSACTAGSAGFKITGLHLLSLVPYLLPLPCSAQWLGPVSIPGNKLTNLCTCGKHFKDKEWGEEEVVCSKMWGEKYERRNLRCVRPRQSHLREKCWENLTFYTCISGEDGQESERREGN